MMVHKNHGERAKEVDAAEEFSGDFSATALRRAFLEGADAAELGT